MRDWETDWQQARTLEDMCECTALWLLGEHERTHNYVGQPDAETSLIRDELVTINRTGLLTEHSQPGYVTPERRQRAVLAAYGALNDVATVVTACRAAGLYVTVEVSLNLPVEIIETYAVPVSEEPHGHVVSRCGFVNGSNHTVKPGRPCDGADMTALRQTVGFCVVDLEWGRNDVLWRTVMGALNERT